MKPERWGSLLVQENYQEEQACDKRHNNIIIIIIIMIIKRGATRTISKSFRKYVSNIPGNREVKELQKTAMLDTAHILRKVLT